MLISRSHPKREEAWVIAATDLYLARRSRTTGLLNRLMEATKPVGFYLAKNLEGYWLWLKACGTFFWVFVGKKLEA
jgi:hypothetical protein